MGASPLVHLGGAMAGAVALAAVLVGLSGPSPPLSVQEPADAAPDYVPEIGQPGKDVIWVPTPDELVGEMLDMAQVTAADTLVDLGSGDGKIAIAAARDRGAAARGIEYNPDLVALSQRRAREAGVADKATFVQGDIFEQDFTDATVVTMYLLPSLNMRLRPTILAMAPGTRVTSHAFDMGDWPPDETRMADGRTAYLWIVPASVGGSWRLSTGATLTLEQSFQTVTGRYGDAALQDVTLRGATLRFTVPPGDGPRRRADLAIDGATLTGVLDGRPVTGRRITPAAPLDPAAGAAAP